MYSQKKKGKDANITLIELKTIKWKQSQGKKTRINIGSVRKYHPVFLNKWKHPIFLSKWSISRVLSLGPKGPRNICPKWAWDSSSYKEISNKSKQRMETRGCMLEHAIKERKWGFLSTASYSARTRRYSMKHQDNQSEPDKMKYLLFKPPLRTVI